jgi:hypothetical protein
VKCRSCGGNRTKAQCNICDLLAAGCGGGISAQRKCWPMVSKALAVHPKQVAQANARNKRHGVNVVYDPTGHAHIPHRAERKRLCKLDGFHDNNGGYSDA